MKINIYRSATNKVFAGVIGGLAEHYQWNPTLARVIFVVLAFTPFSQDHCLSNPLDFDEKPTIKAYPFRSDLLPIQ